MKLKYIIKGGIFAASLALCVVSTGKADAASAKISLNLLSFIENHQSTDILGTAVDSEKIEKAVEAESNLAAAPVTVEEDSEETVIEDTTENSETDPGEEIASRYEKLGVVDDVNNYLNVRAEGSLDGEVIGKVLKYGGVDIIGESDGWYQIEFSVDGEDTDAYVAAEFILTGEEAEEAAAEHAIKMISVTAPILNVREEKSTDSRILTQLNVEEKYEVVEDGDDWVTISLGMDENGETICGYVSADYVEVGEYLSDPVAIEAEEEAEADAEAEAQAAAVSQGQNVVNFAMQYLGGAYVWGGTTLGVGVDCSGFVQAVMANFGVYLPRTSAEQATVGTAIDGSQLQPGDLIFYAADGVNVSHVAIYIGGGQIIHAASPSRGIIISAYNNMTPVKYERVIQ